MLAQETIERVRAEVGILGVVGEVVKLVRRGRSWVGLCPFHQEKTPSFHVNEERGFFHCFGCHASGDALKFVMETEGLGFAEAVRHLAERAGIPVLERSGERESREEADARRRLAAMHEALELAAAWFERQLREHPLAHHARDELARRGLEATSATGPAADALQAFRVGFAPPGWDGLATHLRERGVAPLVAETVGLLVPRKAGPGHYDRFRHRLTFAIVDLGGKVVGFSGRALPEPTPEERRELGLEAPRTDADPPAKYVNSPESPVYRKREMVFGLWQARQAIRQAGEAVLVEGNFDVVSLHARGLRHAVAPLGTAFTPEQARSIRRFAGRVLLFFDGDSAGRRAARAAREPCQAAGLEARVAVLPPGLDPDDLVRRQGVEAVERTLSAARGMLEHLIEEALEDLPADVQGRAAAVKTVVQLLRSEPDPTVRALAEAHADRVAARVAGGDTTFRALQQALREGRTGRPTTAPGPARARSRDLTVAVEREVFGAILDFPELLDETEVMAVLDGLEGELALAIAASRQARAGNRAADAEALLARLPPSIHSFARARMAAPRMEAIDEARTVLLENVAKLRRLEARRHAVTLAEELARAEQAGDFERELRLLEERQRRARERHGL